MNAATEMTISQVALLRIIQNMAPKTDSSRNGSTDYDVDQRGFLGASLEPECPTVVGDCGSQKGRVRLVLRPCPVPKFVVEGKLVADLVKLREEVIPHVKAHFVPNSDLFV